jgi:hypothetical protein
MQCVVCGAAVTEPVYANAWEKARKLFACCGDACAQRFDADTHWIPSVRPAPLDGVEEARLVRLAGERLRGGDQPRMVIRDLLVSGAGVLGVRKALISAELDADATDKTVKKLNIFVWVSGLLGGALHVAERRSQQEQTKLREAASTDLAQWTKHWGLESDSLR